MKWPSGLPKQALCHPFSTHATCSQLAVRSLRGEGGDLFHYTCSNHCPALQTRNSCLRAFPQTSIRRPLISLGPAVWCGHSGDPPCLRQQSSLICSAQSLGQTVPMGTRTLFQTKRSIHKRQAGCVFSPLNQDGRGKAELCQQMGQCYLNWIDGF